MQIIDLSGLWRCEIPGQTAEIRLPGTLDEGHVGHPDVGNKKWHPDNPINENLVTDEVIATRFTRNYTYEGPATLTRRVASAFPEGARVFVDVERARSLSLRVNGTHVPDFVPPSLTTPRAFEVTGLLTGKDELTFISDNSYPGWPHDDIVYSSAATDETQTNWNGLLGNIRLRAERANFIQSVRAYPHGDLLDVCAELSCAAPWAGELRLESPALAAPARGEFAAEAGLSEHWFRDLPLAPNAARWDEEEGNLHTLTVAGEGLEARTISFGIRDFTVQDGHFALNGRRVFLRSEANCAVFPETGHPPMDEAGWEKILLTYRAYGVNCMRFHSHTPPEAAFAAADRMGMLMAPELNHWNPRNAFETEESYAYYRQELAAALKWLANHPSFVMLTFGNELHAGELGHRRMDEQLALAHEIDPTRRFANASNPHYGAIGTDPASDFYSSFNYFEDELRLTSPGMTGALNRDYPNEIRDFSGPMARIREKYAGPVFNFEVGQYEVLPDFAEIDAFHGVTRPDNLSLIRRKVENSGMAADWPRYVEATGELSLLCYRAEIEAALRTEDYSGVSLLGLQDFPGQGTALVGMLNSHLEPKPYAFARPERFAAFFRPALPLVWLEKYTYEAGERLTARVRFANYGRAALRGQLRWTLGEQRGELPEIEAPCGGLTDVGMLAIPLSRLDAPAKLELSVDFAGNGNAYPLWVYPPVEPACPENVYETASLDEKAEAVVAAGGAVFLCPPSDEAHLPRSIAAQFSTDFWSVGTFPAQSGAMGQLIDDAHPIFRRFPTEAHANWQWWPMANRRAMLLPRPMKAIVTEMDSYATLRPMAQLFEARCGKGRVMVSSMGLAWLQRYPEARALLDAIYKYMASDDFAPRQQISLGELREMIR